MRGEEKQVGKKNTFPKDQSSKTENSTPTGGMSGSTPEQLGCQQGRETATAATSAPHLSSPSSAAQ